MMRAFRILLLLPTVWLIGCASAPPAPGCMPLGRAGHICLLPPAQLPAVDATHLVSIERDGHNRTFLGRLEINAQQLQLAGSSLFGTGLFTLRYDGHAISSQPDNPSLHADTLVAMLELTLADPDVLQSRLHGLTLKVSSRNHGEVRELFEGSHLITHIEKSGATPAQQHISIAIPPIKLVVRMTPLAPSGTGP
ncbi:MAG TPA: DUF3261 domain-containing protein [Gammaproteobacteria bacterium]|nr:DUF3261 domain-containing protein [Gammaproteobacteria bacterium]